ncbi:class I SAM-dependent methyltransferase [Nocardia sp. NBC_01329]|uniref:class I SAM-dependent methyltransferase n=1 Tax=Nocardia sp. NBC_01329 TaxID=2903594 RepID=UPI002E1329EC|nr:class I SAM-dependent methyltransferase [Nocardia sp. NBC_01329]
MSTISWTENDETRSARWYSENAAPPPEQVVVVDDRISAQSAYRMGRAGTGLLYRGDFHNARQLMSALDRRLRRDARGGGGGGGGGDAAALFHSHRAARARRAELLGRLLVVLEPDHSLRLRRAPDVRDACGHAYGPPAADDTGPTCVSLPEVLGVLSAYQWHLKGVDIPALRTSVHPAYGVFSPVRGEYIDLVADAPLPPSAPRPVVFDLGTGTGVLAAVLARRGARHVVATDINPRAVVCARANLRRLGLADRTRVDETDLWPSGRADLVVCNPPWLPARPTSDLELGIYDPGSAMLRRFLDGLTAHLTPVGEGWLILSDLAEHLGLRTRAELLAAVADAGLRVLARYDTSPRHPRAADSSDPLHIARAREVTSLWRLVPDSSPAEI